jgi:dTDP-4-amino-4,6-dideoxygalactose transaminase
MNHVPFLDLRAAHDELRPELDRVWADTLDHSGFVGGPELEGFEEEFGRYCSHRLAIGVANGTDALELVLRALGVGVGDEVVVPANTFYATAEAVYQVGADPVFVDVDPSALLVTAEAVEAAIGPRTAAIIVVHLFGQSVDLDAFERLSQRTGIPLVEDAAQAHGARWGDRVAGSVGVAGCFSFYPGKNLGALGDGGAVVTADPDVAATVRSLSNHGRDAGHPTGHRAVGRNSRLDALQAGVLRRKLPRLDDWNRQRRSIWSRYVDGFAGTAVRPLAIPDRCTSVHHLAVVRVPRREEVRRRLSGAGVATGVHYPVPCHRLPPLDDGTHAPLPVTEAAAGEILSLPMYPQLPDHAIDVVIERVRDAVDDLGQVDAA